MNPDSSGVEWSPSKETSGAFRSWHDSEVRICWTISVSPKDEA